MKKFFFILSICLMIQITQTYAAPLFSEPVIEKSYNQVSLRIDKKVAGIILDENAKKSIELKKEILGNILLLVDAAVKNHDRVKAHEQIILFRNTYKETILFIQNIEQSTPAPVLNKNIPKIIEEVGVTGKNTDITYYADRFEGGKTANGNTFSQSYYSAAVCDIPFNTLVQVGKGGSSVIVKINDRPNCSKFPNLTDLTKIAFERIGKLSTGKLQGTIYTLGSVSKGYTKKLLGVDTFKNLGILLDPGTPNTYLKNETFHVTGKEIGGKEHTILYMKSPSGKDITFGMKKGADGYFEYNYPLEEIGVYSLVISSGLGFNTSTFSDITVLDDTLFTRKKNIGETQKSEQIDSIQTERIELSDLSSIYLFHFPTTDFHTMTIHGEKETFTYRGFGNIAIRGNTLRSLDVEKPILVEVVSQKTSTAFSHDTYTNPVSIFNKTMVLTAGYKEEKNENIITKEVDGNLIITGLAPKGKNIKSDIMLTLPNGLVEKYSFDASYIDTDGNMKRGKPFQKSIPLKQIGLYLVEVNYDNGFAAYNGPIIHGSVLPVYPNEYDNVEKKISGNDGSIVTKDSLEYINNIRIRSGRNALVIDSTLNKLATIKANDMAAHNNLSHTDSNGYKINGTAKQNNVKILGSIGENIAGGNVSHNALLIGLANSGGHRANMLDKWTKVGIGYVVKEGQVYYVQIFGE